MFFSPAFGFSLGMFVCAPFFLFSLLLLRFALHRVLGLLGPSQKTAQQWEQPNG